MTPAAPVEGQRRRTWLSGRALLCHLGVLVMAPGCMLAFWWQLHRALAGNNLSWAYTFEWPFFAAFAVVAWWQLLHDDPETVGRRGLERTRAASGLRDEAPAWAVEPGPGDEDLVAYNRYLAGLAASGRRKTWREP